MLSKLLHVKIKEGDTNLKVVIKPENYEVHRNLKILYAQQYRELIKRGVATRSAMLDLLKQEGMWREEEENKFNNLLVEAALLESLLENIPETDNVKQKETVIKLAKIRNAMLELIQIKTEPMEYVAETIADDIIKENYLVFSTFYEDGRKYFGSYEDFKNRREEDNVKKIVATFNDELSKLNTKQLLDLPENKWLMKNGYMDKEGQVANEEVKKELETPVEVNIKEIAQSLEEVIKVE